MSDHTIYEQVQKVEAYRITSAVFRPLYILVCPNGKRRRFMTILNMTLIL